MRDRPKCYKAGIRFAVALLMGFATLLQADEESSIETPDPASELSLAEITGFERKVVLKGERPKAGERVVELLVDFGEEMSFIARPVFLLVTAPVPNPTDPGDFTGHKTGFGDIQLLSLIGPDRAEGFVWGLGSTFKFPTANDDLFGAGKWQAGPAAMLLNLGDKWTSGLVIQHWWSFAGGCTGDRFDWSRGDSHLRRTTTSA